MTIDEAISLLKRYIDYNNPDIPDFYTMEEACKVVIKVLDQEQCGDCIRRSDIGLTDFEIVMCNGDYKEALKMLLNKIEKAPSVTPMQQWISVKERLPETDNKNSINKYNVLLWVANKSHPEREPQIYLGKLKQVSGDDGSGNFWGIETKPCDWTIWGWCYFDEPDVRAWMPLPESYKEVI